jgi:hypothetical protein
MILGLKCLDEFIHSGWDTEQVANNDTLRRIIGIRYT